MSIMVSVEELSSDVMHVVERLISEQITIKEIYEGDVDYDPAIELIDGYCIQVCQDGTYCLVEDDKYIFETEDFNEFITVLKEFV